MSDILRLRTLALLSQELFERALENGGSLDSAATDMLLHPAYMPGEKAGANGADRLLHEAALMRQGSQNASTVAVMATMVTNACLAIGERLSDMQTLLQSVAGRQMDPSIAAKAYMKLVSSIIGILAETQYKDISLLDRDAWAQDERLSAMAGNTVSFSFQMGANEAVFVLHDLSPLKGLAEIDLHQEYAMNGMQALIKVITENIESITTLATSYEALAFSYTNEAKRMHNQADILAQRAALTRTGGVPSLPPGP